MIIRGVHIPVKKNRYIIKESRSSERWKVENGKVRLAKPKRWIGPAQAVKDAEEHVAWQARAHWKRKITGPVALHVAVAGKKLKDVAIDIRPAEGPVGRQYGDLDGLVTTLMDALQKWPLEDDSQVVEVHLVRKEKL